MEIILSRQGMRYQPPLKVSNVIDGLEVGYLKLFGFWKIMNDFRTTGKRNAFIHFKFYMAILISTPYIILQLTSYFVIDMDLQKATIMNIHCLPAITLWGRMMVFWFRIGNQCNLYSMTQKDFLSIPEYKMAKASAINRNITKNANLMCILAFIVDFSITVVTIGFPGIPVDYILHGKGVMMDSSAGKKKILSGWYPLPMDQSPYYEIIFIYEMTCVFIGGIFLAIYNCLFYQGVVALYAQFEVLRYHASTVDITANSNSNGTNKNKNNLNSNYNNSHRPEMDDEIRNSGVSDELYSILQDHQRLLSFAKELRSVYNPLITMNLGPGICLLIVTIFQYQARKSENTMLVFRALHYLAAQLVEIVMLCLISSSLQTASSDLQLAIYSSDWYKADVKFRKTAQMLMVGAMKGVTLTAVKIYPINKETLMSIFQFAYSTSALMSGMLEEKS